MSLGVSARLARKTLLELETTTQFIKYDTVGSYVLIPDYLKRNAPDTPSHKQIVINDIALPNSGHLLYETVLETLWERQGALPVQAFDEVRRRRNELAVKSGKTIVIRESEEKLDKPSLRSPVEAPKKLVFDPLSEPLRHRDANMSRTCIS